MARSYIPQGLEWPKQEEFHNLLAGMAADEEEVKDNRIARGKAAFERAGGSGAFGHHGLEFALDTHRQGLQNHANAANAINSAISNEMDSRVAQQREMRRMAHEKEMMRMRLEAQRRDEEGNIIRSLLNG